MSRDEDGFYNSCPTCGHSPVLSAKVARDRISKTTGEITARAGAVWVLCPHCIFAPLPDEFAPAPDP